jgi:hypothetical protein
MTAFAGWQIDLVDGTGATDITSFVQGFNIQCKVKIGAFTPTDVVLTLNNNGGDFTPAEGGGTGTYASVDWLTKAIKISPSADTDRYTAHVFVSDFNMRDDGTNSSVQLICQDWLSLASSQVFDIAENTTTTPFGPFIDNVLQGASGYGPGATLPNYGQPTYPQEIFLFDLGDSTADRMARPAATNVSTLDYINQAVFGGYPSIVIPTDAKIGEYISPPGTFYVAYVGTVLNRTLTYRNPFRIPVAFSDNPTGTTLAFADLEPGFNFDELTSTANVTSGITGVTSQTSTNTSTGNNYGTRARFYNETGNNNETDNGNDAGALEAAEFWTKRQEAARYIPRRLTTSIELIDDRNGTAAATTLINLMAAVDGLFQPCDITYTPTGGSQVTANCVISGRTIQAVPGRTTIVLDLLPAQDYQSFVLDSDTLGVLDTNRLG